MHEVSFVERIELAAWHGVIANTGKRLHANMPGVELYASFGAALGYDEDGHLILDMLRAKQYTLYPQSTDEDNDDFKLLTNRDRPLVWAGELPRGIDKPTITMLEHPSSVPESYPTASESFPCSAASCKYPKEPGGNFPLVLLFDAEKCTLRMQGHDLWVTARMNGSLELSGHVKTLETHRVRQHLW